MATLLHGEARAILQPAGYAQYRGAWCPPGVPFKEVRTGPMDGKTNIAVRVGVDGSVPALMAFSDGTVVYEYDGRDKRKRVVYRYAPNLSSAHRDFMIAVAEVYAEHALKQAGGTT